MAEGAHGVLRGAVDGAAGVDLAAGDGAEVDDVASAAGDHARGDGAGDVEQAFDVGVDHAFPVVGVALVDRLETDGQSGVVDERVDGLPFVGQAGDGLLDGLTATDVEGERQEAALGIGAGQLVAEVFEAFAASAGEDQVVAILGQYVGRSPTDACGGTGDHCDGLHRG